MKRVGLALVALVLASACSSGGSTTSSGDVAGDADGLTEDGFGEGRPELAGEGLVETVPGEVGSELPELIPDVPPEGDLGDPCETNEDCLSGLCIEWGEGTQCTVACTEDCPNGMFCAQIGTGDPLFACVPNGVTQCMPCVANADCAGPYAEKAESVACMKYGSDGSFCATSCATDEDCPADYACESWFDVEGTGFSGCVRKVGECGCSAYALSAGAKTSCLVGNEFGACAGMRECTDAGLTDCDGPLPAEEACNDEDDDCDGQVDEKLAGGECQVTNEFGTCSGYEVCTGGEVVCDASTPAEEVCDNLDNNCDGTINEGFVDENENGIADCLEQDTDGDLLPDFQDNCIDVPNPDQEDLDADGLGDACDLDLDGDGADNEADCEPTEPTIYPDKKEACNGKDDNCNGEADEGFPDSNGDGVKDCLETDTDLDAIFDYEDNCVTVPNPGQENADGDEAGDACDGDDDNDGSLDDADCMPFDPTVFPEAEEVCNGVDDNCDGAVDEGFADENGNGLADCLEPADEDWDGIPDATDNCLSVPNAGQEDLDGDGLGDACDDDVDGDGILNDADNCAYAANADQVDSDLDGQGDACDGDDDNDGAADELDCSPTDATVYPGALEICNGVDDNCDGSVDEGFGEASCGLGICANTVKTCVDGMPYECQPLAVATDELCDGLDNDCDGLVDEELADQTCGLGPCAVTVSGCVDGKVPICEPLPSSAEACDGVDNDCDGAVDDNLGQETCGLGVCLHTVDLCVNGQMAACDPLAGAGPETCDGLDNDCDGAVDEELPDQTCGVGPCQATVPGCTNGKVPACVPLDVAKPEACDGADNDCNGLADDAIPDQACGVGQCATTAPGCVGGVVPACVPLPSSAEVCDGLDNDCDGAVDNGLGTLTCGLGPCKHTVEACSGGKPQACDPLQGAVPEKCDKLDNDCDGLVDDGLACDTCVQETYNNHVYMFCTKYRTWTDARVVCMQEGLDLAAIGSKDEDQWAATKALSLDPTYAWLFGFNDQAQEGKWVWSNGEPVVYTNWQAGQPSNSQVGGVTENCGSITAFNKTKFWNDVPCISQFAFICEDLDLDGDGISNKLDEDDDGDGAPDAIDNCPVLANADQLDTDKDSKGDACDDDDDGDGFLDKEDCNPLDPLVNPKATEKCDGIDNNCDGVIDPEGASGCSLYYLDGDGDGFGTTESKCLCMAAKPYSATVGGDCDGIDPQINPGAAEKCGDLLDNDCNPATACFWMTQGNWSVPMEPMVSANDVVKFYGYGSPSASSSNTGLELANTFQILLYKSPNGQISLVFLAGKAATQAGAAQLTVTGAAGASVQVADDTGEIQMTNPAAGNATGNWTWGSCCNDGGAIGPIGANAWQNITLKLGGLNNISSVVVRDVAGKTVTVPQPTQPIILHRLP